jgi:hypothetical protein
MVIGKCMYIFKQSICFYILQNVFNVLIFPLLELVSTIATKENNKTTNKLNGRIEELKFQHKRNELH